MDPTEEVIKREIAAAAKILREDGHSVRLSNIEAKLNKHFPDEPEEDPNADPSKPKSPEKKDPKDDPPPKKGLWWGDATNE